MSESLLRVSVIIPTFNRAPVLSRAIDSALGQKDCFVEIIVIDDGSTDNTADIINSYGDKVVYRYKDNGGASSARNAGIDIATGDYIAFLDSDDFFSNANKLKLQANFLKHNNNYGMSYSSVNFIEKDQVYLQDYSNRNFSGHIHPELLLIRNNIIFTPTVMVRKDVFIKSGCFDDKMNFCEDIDLWRRVAKSYKVHQFKEIFTTVNIRSNEIYSILNAVKWRNRLYSKAIKEDNLGIIFIIKLYLELIRTMSLVLRGRIVKFRWS